MLAKKFEGNLSKIKPELLIKENTKDGLSDFFLVLSEIYNDFKGLVYFHVLISDLYEEPASDEITYHAGEYGGLKLQIYKMMSATIHEFFEFLKENTNVTDTTEFKMLTQKMSSSKQNQWKEIVAIATEKSTEGSEFSKILTKIRHNAAYHYYDSAKSLRKGFITRFHKREKTQKNKNEFAYYSLGTDMQHTRFFYADAAVQEYLFEISADGTDTTKHQLKFSEIIESMNDTLTALLTAYLKNRR